jgi:hypothetical protein
MTHYTPYGIIGPKQKKPETVNRTDKRNYLGRLPEIPENMQWTVEKFIDKNGSMRRRKGLSLDRFGFVNYQNQLGNLHHMLSEDGRSVFCTITFKEPQEIKLIKK